MIDRWHGQFYVYDSIYSKIQHSQYDGNDCGLFIFYNVKVIDNLTQNSIELRPKIEYEPGV